MRGAALLRLEHKGVDRIVGGLRQQHRSDGRDERHRRALTELLSPCDPDGRKILPPDRQQVRSLQRLRKLVGAQGDCHLQRLRAGDESARTVASTAGSSSCR